MRKRVEKQLGHLARHVETTCEEVDLEALDKDDRDEQMAGSALLDLEGMPEEAREEIEGVMEIVLVEAAGISYFKPPTSDIPDEAWQMVVRYSAGVSRMVTLGHGLAQWINDVE